jgi:ABC-2 type transport system ATP-binding protein
MDCFAATSSLYHLPGFHEPFSAISHLLGAAMFAYLGVVLLQRGRGDTGRMIFLGIYVWSAVVLLSLSGVYHMMVRGGKAHHVMAILDHDAIFLLIAGSVTAVQGILFRGWVRWAPLLLCWIGAVLGITFKSIFSDEMPAKMMLPFYLLLGWLGIFAGILLARRHGLRFIRYLLLGGLAYTIGALMEAIGWLVIIPGVVHPHELLHVAVLMGAFLQWIFIWDIADGHVPVISAKNMFHNTTTAPPTLAAPLLRDSSFLLRTEGLTKDYGRFRALDSLNLTVRPGEVFGLLGPNGSGKSTALRLIMGFLKPTQGGAWINGHHCWTDGVAARQHVAYLPGELRLYENMTGRQLISFLCNLRGQRQTPELEALATRFDIDLRTPLARMSSGMKRKVALLQVLVLHSSLIIMDEPTNTLDPSMRDELLLQVHRARDQGQSVLFSSHVLAEVERVCDRVCILQHGKLAHLQDMHDLRQGRLVRVSFRQPLQLPSLDGLRIREKNATEASFEYTGELALLLGWLAQVPLVDVRMEPLGLAPIYFRYHGATA